ncbi:hypothetical protein BDZ89DRAFT_1199984 [Hymenopellis radicata]|nr:hypothetical protein BDZ89DRAFT_1199984 [Hymenopellis radicata]
MLQVTMRLILFAALCIGVTLATDSIQRDLFTLKLDVQRATADLVLAGVGGSLQYDLWAISEHLGKATQTLKQYSTIPYAEAAPICTDLMSLGLVPLLDSITFMAPHGQSYGPGTPLCLPVSGVKAAFEYYGREFISRLEDKFICQAAVEVAREIILILDDAVQLLCDH